jgi:hypothetical protein
MTDARLEPIEADPYLAAGFLKRAESFVADGENEGLQPESRQVLLHSATVAACDSALAIKGLQVVGSEGGHKLRLEEVARLLPDADTGLFERLDDARIARNEVSYAAGLSASDDVVHQLEATRDLLFAVKQLVQPELPGWLRGD